MAPVAVARRLVEGWLRLVLHLVRLAPGEIDVLVRRLAGGPERPDVGLTERERLLVQVADEAANQGELSEALWRRLQLLFDEPEQLEVLLLIGHYAMLATVLEPSDRGRTAQ